MPQGKNKVKIATLAKYARMGHPPARFNKAVSADSRTNPTRNSACIYQTCIPIMILSGYAVFHKIGNTARLLVIHPNIGFKALRARVDDLFW